MVPPQLGVLCSAGLLDEIGGGSISAGTGATPLFAWITPVTASGMPAEATLRELPARAVPVTAGRPAGATLLFSLASMPDWAPLPAPVEPATLSGGSAEPRVPPTGLPIAAVAFEAVSATLFLLVFTAAGGGIVGDTTVLADAGLDGAFATLTRSAFALDGAEPGWNSNLPGDGLLLAEASVMVTSPVFALAGAGIKAGKSSASRTKGFDVGTGAFTVFALVLGV